MVHAVTVSLLTERQPEMKWRLEHYVFAEFLTQLFHALLKMKYWSDDRWRINMCFRTGFIMANYSKMACHLNNL